MNGPQVTRIRGVDRIRGYVDIDITPAPGQPAHRIAHLRREGWFCGDPCNTKTCDYIPVAAELVPDIEEPT
jgi:hypothetical protein